MDILNILVTGIVGLLGAIIGGRYALRGVREAHKNNLELANDERQKSINGILWAIYYELAITEGFFKAPLKRLQAAVDLNKPFEELFSLTQEYYIVYPNNISIVGQIESPNLIKSIIYTYNVANKLIESLRLNNSCVEEKNHLVFQVTGSSYGGEIRHARRETLQKDMIAFAKQILEINDDLAAQRNNLQKLIPQYLKEHGYKRKWESQEIIIPMPE